MTGKKKEKNAVKLRKPEPPQRPSQPEPPEPKENSADMEAPEHDQES